MPPGPRSTSRPGAGPGRGRGRARPAARTPPPPPPAPAATPTAAETPTAAATAAEPTRRSNLTTRAIALAVVLLILTISYASSLRIYFAQAHEIAAIKADIASRQQRIDTLSDELARWDDAAYVSAQARERLGWVVPGETGFTVVGADGEPLGGGAQIEAEAEAGPPAPPKDAWWDKMWGSVEAADKPVPPKAKPKKPKPKPITVDTKPR